MSNPDEVVAKMPTKRRMASRLPAPKVLADTATTIIVFVVAYFGIDLDPEVAAAVAKLVGFVAAYYTPPGAVAEVPVVQDA